MKIEWDDVYVTQYDIKGIPLKLNGVVTAIYDKDDSYGWVPNKEVFFQIEKMMHKVHYDNMLRCYTEQQEKIQDKDKNTLSLVEMGYGWSNPGEFTELTEDGSKLWQWVRKCKFNICRVCGTEMLSRYNIQFCSNKCKDEHDKNWLANYDKKQYYFKKQTSTKECIVCGNEFQAKRADAKYCSGKCRTELSRIKKQLKQMEKTNG